MFDYTAAIYHGDPIHTHPPCPLDNQDTALFRELEQVRQEMGPSFAGRLDKILRVELNGGRKRAFQDGFRLGGRLMLDFLDGGKG